MVDPASKLSPRPNELSRQDVFHEINAEIISGRRFKAPRQKTRPNYTHVILLNILLLISAGFGIFVVYQIFREQSIRLTVGTGAIQSLELLLTEQEERRKSEQLRQKEAELRLLQQQAAKISEDLQAIRSDIGKQVNIELERQKSILTADIQQELQGKSDAEKAVIHERYNRELARLQAEAAAETERRVAEATVRQREELQRHEEAQRITQEELVALRAQPAPPPPLPDRTVLPSVYADNGVSALFNSVDRQLKAGDFTAAEGTLRNIERIYARGDTAPPEKRSADLFLVSIIRDYMTLSNHNRALIAQTITLSNGNLRVVADPQADSEMVQFRALIGEISLLARRNPKNPQVAAKIQALQTQSPDVFVFFESYRKYLLASDSERAAPLIARANQLFTQRNYPRAAEQYRDILKNYPGILEQDSVLSNYAATLYALAGRGIPKSPSVVYMKAPDAYILDITENKAILALMPGITLKQNARVNIFKLSTGKGLELSEAGTARVTESKGGYALAEISQTGARIGDLVYLGK